MSILVDDELVATADCSVLPPDGETGTCESIDTEHVVTLDEVVRSDTYSRASVGLDLVGFDYHAATVRAVIQLPDQSEHEAESGFDDILAGDDDGEEDGAPESCATRLCSQGVIEVAWDADGS